MWNRRFLGLQWQLSAINLAAGALGTALAGLGFWTGASNGLDVDGALLVGLGAGLLGGLATSAWGFRLARRLKHRLWSAGDMAARIGRGDLSARLPVVEVDEIGELEAQLNQMAEYLEQAVGQLSRLAEQNRLLAEEAGRGAALEERARIARDLHDTVNQQLFVLSLRAAAVRKRVAREAADRAGETPPQPGAGAARAAAAGAQAAADGTQAAADGAQAAADGAQAAAAGAQAAAIGLDDMLESELAALEELARLAHSQTRALILQLRPTTLEQQGLGPALAEYVRTAAARESWQVEARIDPAIRLRGNRGEALFRVAQEALNNTAKHAGANRIQVSLERVDGQIQLRIADDGVGFDLSAGIRPTSVGLVGMRERMAALGGRIQVRSAPGKGTEVLATLPDEAEVAPAARQGGGSTEADPGGGRK